MNTTIMVGYNDKSFDRKMRLMNVFQSAGKECGDHSTGLQKKVAGLSDSEGGLTIVWAVLPDRKEINAFSKAWVDLGEKEVSITHVWLGMPENPLKQSTKCDHIALMSLCKKIADAYLQEYLLESGKSTAKIEKPATFDGEGSKPVYEPDWKPLKKESSNIINENA